MPASRVCGTNILAGNDEEERRARIAQLLAPDSSRADLNLGVELATPSAQAAAFAEEELAQAMPVDLWTRRAHDRFGDERPVETLAAITGALKRNDRAVHPVLRALLVRVHDVDLFRALAFTLAAARETAVQELLLEAADNVRMEHVGAYIEAVEVCRNPKRDAALTAARRRRTRSDA